MALKTTEFNNNKGSLLQSSQKRSNTDIRKAKWKIIRNIVSLFLIFFASYTAYQSLVILQSSVNGDKGIYSMAVGSILNLISSFFGPYLVRKLTPKWTLFWVCVILTGYTAANLVPYWYVIIPAGALAGMSSAPMWICFGIYCTSMGIQYADLTTQSKEAVLGRLNGFMAAAVPCAIAMGSFWSSFILKNVKFSGDTTDMAENDTIFSEQESLMTNYTEISTSECGIHYCPVSKSTSTADVLPDLRPFYVLVGVLGCFNLLSILFSLFGLQNLTPDQYIAKKETPEHKQDQSSIRKSSWNYLKAFFNWRFVLLTPYIGYIYLFMTLFVSMFPRAYITCYVGVSMIGYITLARGISDLLTCTMLGFVAQCCHRTFWLGLAISSILGITLMLFTWDYLPSGDSVLIMLFVLSAIGGVANSINISQFTAFLGAVFTDKKTEAFSYLHFAHSVFVALGFYSNIYLCTVVQLFILLTLIILGGLAYIIFEIHLKLQNRGSSEANLSIENLNETKSLKDATNILELD